MYLIAYRPPAAVGNSSSALCSDRALRALRTSHDTNLAGEVYNSFDVLPSAEHSGVRLVFWTSARPSGRQARALKSTPQWHPKTPTAPKTPNPPKTPKTPKTP